MPSPAPTQDNPLQLATLSPGGKPPSQRLASATDAVNIYWTLMQAAQPRLSKGAIIQGLFDGNPPYNVAKLRNQGQAWRSNFNTLEALGRLEAAKAPYFDLFSSATALVSADTRVEGERTDATTASRIRSDLFNEMLATYADFDNEMDTLLNDFVAFNKGFLWWPRPDSWHFERLEWNRVLFPDGTTTNPSKWELFALRHTWPVHKLYGFVKDTEAARRAGWNVEAVWRAIRTAVPDDLGRSYEDPMQLQQAFRDSELFMSAKCGTVQAASIYTREFPTQAGESGKWSRMMVQVEDNPTKGATSSQPESMVERSTRDAGRQELEAQRGAKDWLFNKPRVADTLQDILVPFIFDRGTGSINEMSGLGKKIVSISQAKDRIDNTLADNTLMRGCINLQATTGQGQQKAGIVQIGGGVVTIPAGYNVQPGTIFGDIEGGIAVSQYLDNKLDRNTGSYRPTFEKPTGNPEPATTAQIRFSQATVLSNSAVQRFYKQLDTFYYQLLKRATAKLPATSGDEGVRAAVEFQDACLAAGLTEKQLRDCKPSLVRAVRAIGNGSPALRQQSLAALGQIVPYMGPRGLVAWKQDYAAAFAGQQGAARYFPEADLHDEPTNAMREAVGENNDMQTGAQVLFLESDDHEQHAKVHLTAAVGAVRAVLEQGADPAMPFTFLQLALPHAAQHISKVPREQVRKALEQAYKQVAEGAKQVFAAAEKQAQQQGQANSISFEQQLAVQELQHKQAMAEAKSKGMLDLKAQRQQFEMQLTQAKTAQEGALKDATTAQDIQRTTAQTATAIQLEQAKTASEIEISKRKAEADIEVARKKAEQQPAKGGAK